MQMHIVMDETEERVTPIKLGVVLAFASDVLGQDFNFNLDGDPDDTHDVRVAMDEFILQNEDVLNSGEWVEGEVPMIWDHLRMKALNPTYT